MISLRIPGTKGVQDLGFNIMKCGTSYTTQDKSWTSWWERNSHLTKSIFAECGNVATYARVNNWHYYVCECASSFFNGFEETAITSSHGLTSSVHKTFLIEKSECLLLVTQKLVVTKMCICQNNMFTPKRTPLQPNSQLLDPF